MKRESGRRRPTRSLSLESRSASGRSVRISRFRSNSCWWTSPGRLDPRWVAVVLALCLFNLVTSARAAAPPGTQERLRHLVRLPRLSFTVEIGCGPSAGYYSVWSATPTMSDLGPTRPDSPAGIERAARAREVGIRHLQAGAHERARTALKDALNQLRALGAPQSADAAILADYARTLMLLGQFEEARREAYRATEMALGDSRAHATLARCLAASAVAEFAPASSSSESLADLRPSGLVSSEGRTAPAGADRARQLSQEALRAADQAVALAPQDAAVRLDRAVARAMDQLVRFLIEAPSAAELTPVRLQQAVFPAEALEDLRRAAELEPANARLLGTAAMVSVMAAVLERGVANIESLLSSGAWSLLDESPRRQLRADLARLEDLSATGELSARATAQELVGVIQMLALSDFAAAEANLRRVLVSDPERESAWEALVLLLVTSNRFETLAAACESRLERRESARDHLLLAKAYSAVGDNAKVLTALEPARRRHPEDFNINLASAAALLRGAGDDTTLAQAAQLISRAEKAAGNQATAEQTANLLFLRGMFLALIDRSELARSHLERVLELDPGREEAREALKLID